MEQASTPTLTMFFDTRGCAVGKASVKWYIYFQDKQRMFSTGKQVTVSEAKFLKQYPQRLPGSVKDDDKRQLWKEIYDDIQGKGEAVIKELGDRFTLDGFREMINGRTPKNDDSDKELTDSVFDWYDSIIKELRSKKQLGNADNYESSSRSLQRFVSQMSARERARCGIEKGRPIKFRNITADLLEYYEGWMLLKGKLGPLKKDGTRSESPASYTTISMYVRALRAVYNAQDNKYTDPRSWPFGKSGYVIPETEDSHSAWNSEDLAAVLAYKAPDKKPFRQRARDLWVFSYLGNGTNFADILRLKNEHDKGGEFRYHREKVKRTKKSGKLEIIVKILPEMRRIMNKWANPDKRPGAAIWEFMSKVDFDDAERLDSAISNVIVNTNRNMVKIASELGITGELGTYAARHSFGTTLLRSGAPMEFISEQFGHASFKTTKRYFGRFEDNQISKYLSALLVGTEPEEKEEASGESES